MDDLIAILTDLSDRELEDVRLYAISRAVGAAAMNDLAGPEMDILHSRHRSKLVNWGLVDPFSWKKTKQGKLLIRKFKPGAQDAAG